MTVSLASLLRDAVELKNSVVDARKDGAITQLEAQQVLTGIAQVIKSLKDIAARTPDAARAWLNGPLSEYHDWPNDRTPCPKCGDVKPAGRHYMPASKDGPERMQHRYCGYVIYTKPLDETERDDVLALFPEPTRPTASSEGPSHD